MFLPSLVAGSSQLPQEAAMTQSGSHGDWSRGRYPLKAQCMGSFLGNVETGSEKEQMVSFPMQRCSLSWARHRPCFSMRGAEGGSRSAERSGGEMLGASSLCFPTAP